MQGLLKAIEWVVIGLLAVIAATVIAEVVLRGIFDLSLGVHEELTRYLMIWVAMLGSVLLTHENGHIRISLLPDRLSGTSAAFVLCAADLVIVFFLSVFVYACATNLPSIVGQNTITLGVGMVWFHAALPVGGFLMLVIAIGNLLGHLRLFAEPEKT